MLLTLNAKILLYYHLHSHTQLKGCKSIRATVSTECKTISVLDIEWVVYCGVSMGEDREGVWV